MKSKVFFFGAILAIDSVNSEKLSAQNLPIINDSKLLSEETSGSDEKRRRRLYYQGYRSWSNTWHGDEMKKSSKKGSKKGVKSSKKGSKIMEEKEEPEGHTLLKPFTCPGGCISVFEFPDVEPPFIYPTLVECDECDPDQRWKINTVKDQYVQIENVGTGLCIAPVLDVLDDDVVCGPDSELVACETLMDNPNDSTLWVSVGGTFISVECMGLFPPETIYLDPYGSFFCETGIPAPDAGPPILTTPPVVGTFLSQDFVILEEDCPLHPGACPNMWY